MVGLLADEIEKNGSCRTTYFALEKACYWYVFIFSFWEKIKYQFFFILKV